MPFSDLFQSFSSVVRFNCLKAQRCQQINQHGPVGLMIIHDEDGEGRPFETENSTGLVWNGWRGTLNKHEGHAEPEAAALSGRTFHLQFAAHHSNQIAADRQS